MFYNHRLYGLWKSETYSNNPMLMRKKADIQKKSKAIMQRISKENVKPTSRKIGKITNSSPVLLFDYVSVYLFQYIVIKFIIRYMLSDIMGIEMIKNKSHPNSNLN